MNRLTVLYRGNLKSCNYHCTYCPFSKHSMGERELEEDRVKWFRFVESLKERAFREKVREQVGAVMVVPYGEALIHPWYWEGLGQMSLLEGMGGVGCQTNLSFSEKEALDWFVSAGGKVEKLHLWATFHPEMVSAETFAEKCRKLLEQGVSLCAGAVGVPEQIKQIEKLKMLLPGEIYLWVNQMDGRKRPYTDREKQAFLDIDPYFWRELEKMPSEASHCAKRCFVEADGTLRLCNISQKMPGNWYEGGLEEAGFLQVCRRRECSCYLAYGGRDDFMNDILFGPYPIFRIPRRPKAVFLDIEGTLLPYRDDGIRGLDTLVRQNTQLFFATTLPLADAFKRCKEIWHLFKGGVFAGGSRILLKGEKRDWEYIYELEPELYFSAQQLKGKYGVQILAYLKEEQLYKLTFIRPAKKPWAREEARRFIALLGPEHVEKIRWYVEGNCLQVVAKEADKANGVRMILKWLDIPLTEAAAAGDSKEDEEMMRITGKDFSSTALH